MAVVNTNPSGGAPIPGSGCVRTPSEVGARFSRERCITGASFWQEIQVPAAKHPAGDWPACPSPARSRLSCASALLTGTLVRTHFIIVAGIERVLARMRGMNYLPID